MPEITKKFCDNKIKVLEEQITSDNSREIEKEIISWYKIRRELIENETRRQLRQDDQLRREIRQMINNIIINPLNLSD